MQEYEGVKYNDLKLGEALTKNVSVEAGESFEEGQVLSETNGLVKAIETGEEGAYIAKESCEVSSDVQVVSVYEAGIFNESELKGYDLEYEPSLRKNNILVRGGIK